VQIQTNPPAGQPPGGTVSVTNDSTLVYAQADIDWSQVGPGCVFMVKGDGVSYTVAANPILVGATYHIALTAPYAGPTNAGAAYVIHKDFFSNGAPIFAVGDTELYTLLNRWLQAQTGLGSGLGAAGLVTLQIPIAGALIGATEIYCTFSPTLASPPAFIAHPIIAKANPADDNVMVTSIDTVSKIGFSMNLSAPAIAGHIIHCGWIPSTGAPTPPPPPPPAAAGRILSEADAVLLGEGGAILHIEPTIITTT
jgi:hypothetical protein